MLEKLKQATDACETIYCSAIQEQKLGSKLSDQPSADYRTTKYNTFKQAHKGMLCSSQKQL